MFWSERISIYGIFKDNNKVGCLYWKTTSVYFMTLPSREYEGGGPDDDVRDLDNFGKVTNCRSLDDILIGTFSKINFLIAMKYPIKYLKKN